MYTHFYEFFEEPFGDAPDPKFLFLPPGHQQVVNCVMQGIEGKKNWILLLGDAGTGKTLFIHHMLNLLKEKPDLKAAFIFQSHIQFEDFIKEVLSALNWPSAPPNGVPVADHFKQYLKSQLSPGGRLVIFIDEAQGFAVKVLKEIEKFFTQDPKDFPAIQIVLAGQPSLGEKLKSQELWSLSRKIEVRCAITSLTAKESERYIDHRLHLAGGKSEIFAPEALALIVRNADGVPRILNLICDNSLRIGHQVSQSIITASTVQKALKGMYFEKARPSLPFKGKQESPIARKVLYLLTGVGILILVIVIGHKFLGSNRGRHVASQPPKPTFGAVKVPIPPMPLPKEKPLAPPPSVPETAQKPDQTKPSVSGSAVRPKTETRIKKVIIVKQGKTLNLLCEENYGWAHITLLDYILQSNPQIIDPNLILVGERISLPEISEESLLIPLADGAFKISLGTFGEHDEIQVFKKNSILKGKDIRLARRTLPQETWYRIEAGNFPSEDEALKVIRDLRKQGLLPALPR